MQQDHDELRSLMARSAILMASSREEDRAEMLRLRVAFNRLFNRHVADESARVRAALSRAPDERSRRIALAYPVSLQKLSRDYSTHVHHWTPDAIARHPQEYRAAVVALQERLRLQLVWEEAAVFPLLATLADDRAAA